eukprot:4396139-Prymnesium_polylepis.1
MRIGYLCASPAPATSLCAAVPAVDASGALTQMFARSGPLPRAMSYGVRCDRRISRLTIKKSGIFGGGPLS